MAGQSLEHVAMGHESNNSIDEYEYVQHHLLRGGRRETKYRAMRITAFHAHATQTQTHRDAEMIPDHRDPAPPINDDMYYALHFDQSGKLSGQLIRIIAFREINEYEEKEENNGIGLLQA